MGHCGHRCTLLPLAQYLETGENDACPVCNNAHVTSVCDEVAASILKRTASSGKPGTNTEQQQELDRSSSSSIVAFRYGKHLYRLAVGGGENQEQTAQERIAYVLGLDINGDELQILHKGEIIYPPESTSNSSSSEAISSQLLEISKNDIQSYKKPSLIIMGKRAGRYGSHAGHYRH